MFVIPVNPALSIDSEQSSYKIKNNPAFGMQVTRETELFLKKAADIATANPNSRLKVQLVKLMEVIEQATIAGRENDGLKLEIVPLWEGFEGFTMDARVKLESIGRKVEDKVLSITRIIDNRSDALEGETIIDVALNLLADKNGKVLRPIRLHEAIVKAQEGLTNGIEHIRVEVVEPIRKKVDEWTPEIPEGFNNGIGRARLKLVGAVEPLQQRIKRAVAPLKAKISGHWAPETQAS